jgi:hypothetical protein
MTGNEYADLIAAYIAANFPERGLAVYREVPVGMSIIGKKRRIDVFVVCESQHDALAIECKYQEFQGTVDEKIPYTLQDMAALRMPGCVAYAGPGFSEGVLHMLQSSEMAAYCLPEREDLLSKKSTLELDHVIALTFRWWDLLVRDRSPITQPTGTR